MKTVLAAAALCVVCVFATPQPFRDTFKGWKKRMDHTSKSVSSDDANNNNNFIDDDDLQQYLPQIALGNSQVMLRTARGPRQFDVPQIECPRAADNMQRFACPTPDRQGRYHCIDDHVLCDGFIDCPAAEDEDRQSCMFYKTTKEHLDVLVEAMLRWARGR